MNNGFGFGVHFGVMSVAGMTFLLAIVGIILLADDLRQRGSSLGFYAHMALISIGAISGLAFWGHVISEQVAMGRLPFLAASPVFQAMAVAIITLVLLIVAFCFGNWEQIVKYWRLAQYNREKRRALAHNMPPPPRPTF